MQDLVAGPCGCDVRWAWLIGAADQRRPAAATRPSQQPSALPAFLDMPTSAEAGLPGYEVSTWYAIWAPKGTPPDIVARMTKELQTALKAPAIAAAWERNGSEVPTLTGADFGKFVEFRSRALGQGGQGCGRETRMRFTPPANAPPSTLIAVPVI